jgi:hypothetical protein
VYNSELSELFHFTVLQRLRYGDGEFVRFICLVCRLSTVGIVIRGTFQFVVIYNRELFKLLQFIFQDLNVSKPVTYPRTSHLICPSPC